MTGIYKKRWRILKNHMLIRNKAQIDNILFTCAILHNMLIAHDKWEDEDDEDDLNITWTKELLTLEMVQSIEAMQAEVILCKLMLKWTASGRYCAQS
jgi:hypothetical protein